MTEPKHSPRASASAGLKKRLSSFRASQPLLRNRCSAAAPPPSSAHELQPASEEATDSSELPPIEPAALAPPAPSAILERRGSMLGFNLARAAAKLQAAQRGKQVGVAAG